MRVAGPASPVGLLYRPRLQNSPKERFERWPRNVRRHRSSSRFATAPSAVKPAARRSRRGCSSLGGSGCGRIFPPEQMSRARPGRCVPCAKTYEREKSRARRARLGTTSQRGYGSDYQRRREAAIRAQPWCSDCGHTGSENNPLTAEHVVPVSQGGKDGPLTVLCRSCNSSRCGAIKREASF
jgi:5-methylcytosine-specific restriction endonuclease McrA